MKQKHIKMVVRTAQIRLKCAKTLRNAGHLPWLRGVQIHRLDPLRPLRKLPLITPSQRQNNHKISTKLTTNWNSNKPRSSGIGLAEPEPVAHLDLQPERLQEAQAENNIWSDLSPNHTQLLPNTHKKKNGRADWSEQRERAGQSSDPRTYHGGGNGVGRAGEPGRAGGAKP